MSGVVVGYRNLGLRPLSCAWFDGLMTSQGQADIKLNWIHLASRFPVSSLN